MTHMFVSNCCASNFDPLGYEKEEGIWQERCMECGKLCEPLDLHEDVVKNIKTCKRMEKEEDDRINISITKIDKSGEETEIRNLTITKPYHKQYKFIMFNDQWKR